MRVAGLMFLLVWVLCPLAQAHPLSQGALDVTISPDRVAVRVRVTVEEVSVTNAATTADAAPGPWGVTGSAAYEQHAAYLAAHLHVVADGVPLAGGVATVEPPADPEPKSDDHAVYQLIYPLPPHARPPAKVQLRSDVLADADVGPGVKWEATYVVRISQSGGPATEGLLLTRQTPADFSCDWNPHAGPGPSPAARSGRMFRDYFLHGVHHILTGYDHLLFISALVLGAMRLWDLIKVVTAFTLAHTLTLTLAALNLVHVPEQIVEPLIAGSIVFVAIENVLWPARSRGRMRLAAAFFFGLFHGLGFAGGLLDAMQGMSGTVILVAIAAFSMGVEAGHQAVVLPLFAGLKLARRAQPDEARRYRFALNIQRFGSVAISLAGLFYLVVALRLSFVAFVR